MTDAVVIRTAFACEDIRTEQSGKLIAIGLINPILGLGDKRSSSSSPALRFHFLLSIDVSRTGEHHLIFRLRGLTAPLGQTVKLGVVFTELAKNIPFPIGPLVLPLSGEERGFKLQQQVGNRWRTIATWRFEESD